MSVLVTDAGGNHALATVRSLGQRGIRVAVADSARSSKGLYSRYCATRATYPSASSGIAAFQSGLCSILDQLRPRVLMPMTERTILGLIDNRAAIESRVHLPLAASETLRLAFDKSETMRLAKSLAVPVPTTYSLAHLGELDGVREQLSYPAVIKPRTSEVRTSDGRILSSGAVEYCFGPHDLAARYLAVHRRAPLPLIQEYVPGQGYGISALCNRGKVKALFAHRRLRMIRPTGSGSSLRESILPPPLMVESAYRLLEALQWHGVAMVEFKLDARDGTPKLMEINGRFWNSLPLAVAAGVDFPFLLYRLATEGDCPECFDYRPGVRCRWLVGDAQHLIEVFRGRPERWTDDFPSRRETLLNFMKFVGHDLHYDDFWFSDPVPFFAELADVVLRQLPQFALRQRARVVEELPAA